MNRRSLRSVTPLSLVAALISLGFALPGWLIAGNAGALAGVLLALAAQLAAWLGSRPILLRVSTSTPASDEMHGDLIRCVKRLAQAADIQTPLVAISHVRTPNAYAAATPGGGIVGVTEGLLELLTGAELEAVLAHEVAHLARGDRAAATIAAVFAALPGRLCAGSGSHLFYDAAFRSDAHRTQDGGWRRSLRAAVAFCCVPLVSIIVRASTTKAAEIRADLDAIRLESSAAAMGSALRKINALAGRVASPVNPAVSHMLVIHPFGARRAGRILDIHPTLEARLTAIERVSGRASIC
jgi:heat shock protein HtpX